MRARRCSRCTRAPARRCTRGPPTGTRSRASWTHSTLRSSAMDIKTPEDVLAMRNHTGCAGIMVARGSFGNPWLFAQARDLLSGRAKRPDPRPAERFAVALEHARLALRLQGDTRKTALEFRKHLGWYTKGLRDATELRQRLFTIDSMAQAEEIFSEYLLGSVRSAA